MKKILTLALALSLALTLAAAPKNTNEAEYLYYNQTYSLNSDGTQSARTSYALKVFTHTAMNSVYTETQILYNPTYQKVVINAAYVIQSDGNRIDAPSNSITEFLPQSAANSAFYNNIRSVCVIHTGLDLGSTIYLDYTVESSADYLPELDVYAVLQQTSPVDKAVISVNAPAGRKIRYHMHDAGIGFTSSEGEHSIAFTLTNIPASSKDPGTSVLCGDIPFLTASTWPTDGDALAYLGNQIGKNPGTEDIVLPAENTDSLYGYFLSDVMRCEALKAIKDSHDSDAKAAAAIRKRCETGFGTITVPLSTAAFRTRRADAILKSASGTEFEKANIEAVMMAACGIPSEVGASFCVPLSCNVLPLSAIDHIFTWSADCPYLSNASIVPIRSLSFEAARSEGPRHHSKNAPKNDDQPELKANPRLATSQTAPLRNGNFDPFADGVRSANAHGKLEFTATVNVTPDAVLCDDLTGGKLIKTSGASSTDGTPIVVLPGSDKGLAHNNPYAKMAYSERTGALLLPYAPIDESYDYTVNITVVANDPDNKAALSTDPYTVAMNSHQMPMAFNTQPVDIVNSVGSVHQRIMTTSDGFHVTRSIRIDKQVINAADFADFHALVAEWYAMFN